MSLRSLFGGIVADSPVPLVSRYATGRGAGLLGGWGTRSRAADLEAITAGRHGLVLGGLAAFTLAASMHSTIVGLIVGGLSLFFLELRRR